MIASVTSATAGSEPDPDGKPVQTLTGSGTCLDLLPITERAKW